MIKRLITFFEECTGRAEARRASEHNERIRSQNADLKSRMKPRGREQAGYFVPRSEEHIVIPVNLPRLKEHLGRGKEFDSLDKSRLYLCRRAFADNNNLMPMIQLCLDERGDIRLRDGNHRLQALTTMGEENILVFVGRSTFDSDEDMQRAAGVIREKCGVPGARVESVDGNYVYCNIEYEAAGSSMVPRIYEQQYAGKYFVIPG